MPVAFNRKYIIFKHHAMLNLGVSLPVVGTMIADDKIHATQQFARERNIDAKQLFAQSWARAALAEREEADVLQAEWEAQQHENMIDVLDEMAVESLQREGLPNAHVSDGINYADQPAQRKELLELYDRTVKRL